MSVSRSTFVKFSSLGLGVFIFLFLMYPISMPVIDYKQILIIRQPPPKHHNPFSDIERRIEQDKQNLERLCLEYYSSPRSSAPKIRNIKTENYYMNAERKLGWCINAKVN